MTTTRPELTGSFGMVASTHWLASGVGMSVLERGGNAFDAAVAAGFTLQIVEPHLNGPGGDLPAIVWDAATAQSHVVCGQGVSPAAATIDAFTDLGLTLVPGSGPLAATVPGAFGGWTTMLQRWGTWELADVLAPALSYAEAGFPVLPAMSRTIASVRQLFLEHWEPSARVWLDRGAVPAAGRQWRTPVLAATYRRILVEAIGATREQRIEAARDAWYRGFVAESIASFHTTAWRDTSGRDHAGLLTGDDLARWHAGVEPPVGADVAGRYRVLKTAAWGQGPVLLAQLCQLDALGLADVEVRGADWVHLIVESAKLAFADREAWYGDADDVPLDTLLGADYVQSRAALVGDRASLELLPGSPDGRRPRLAVLDSDARPSAGAGEPTLALRHPDVEPQVDSQGAVRGDTCHLDVVDQWGNMVSATPSGGWLQSSPVIGELGFPLGTRAQMFYLDPGLPNSLRPGVRPRTTLSPSLVLRDGDPWLALGTPGGDQQDQWQTAFLAGLFVADRAGGANLQAEIDAPMFHTNHFPSSFYPRESIPGQVLAEDRLGEEVLGALESRGHGIVRAGRWTLGRLSAVSKEGALLRAGANARGAQGYAAGR